MSQGTGDRVSTDSGIRVLQTAPLPDTLAPITTAPPDADFYLRDYQAATAGDYSVAFAKAIRDMVLAGGGTLYMTPGVFATPNIDVSLPTAGLVTLKFKGAGMYATTIQVSGSSYLVNCSANGRWAAQVLMEDLTLDGNYAGKGGSVPQPQVLAQALINLPSPNNTPTGNTLNGLYHQYTRVRFYRPAGYAFQPVAGSILTDCVFDSCGQPDVAVGGLHWDNLGSGGQCDCIAIGCTWVNSSGNYADFVSGVGGGPIRLTMALCKSFNHQIGGVYAGGIGSIIIGNTLVNANAGSGVGYDSGTVAAYKSNNLMLGNVFVNMIVTGGAAPFTAANGDFMFGNIASDSAGGFMLQPLRAPDGTVAAPGQSFAGDASLGWYRGGGGSIALASGGNNIITLGPGVNPADVDVNALNGIMRLYSSVKIQSRVNHEFLGNIGFFGAAAGAKPVVTGSRVANPALASLLTGLAGLGLLTDSSS